MCAVCVNGEITPCFTFWQNDIYKANWHYLWFKLPCACVRVCVSVCVSCSVMSDSCGLQPARFLCQQNSPGKKTRVGCHSLLQVKLPSVQFSSVAQSCPTLCDPNNCSTPGLPVHHQLPEFTQTHVHPVRDAIQPSHPLSSPSPPAPNPSQHQSLFQWVNSSHEVAKVLEFQL